MPFLEEVFTQLPEIGLRVVNMGERPGLAEGRWTVQLSNSAFGDPKAEIYHATGPTAGEAMTAALARAGVNIND